jgi:hypothetical protein
MATAPPKLTLALRGQPESDAVSPVDLFHLARKRWRAGERVDVGKLAAAS